ncbi:MAG: PilW family protein [Burkholderiales bacterium]|nr:PilW family protein [Burkholderiales bacterium]
MHKIYSMAPAGKLQQCGYTIMELMISIAIGLLLITGLTTIFVGNSRARNELELANQQVENGRYAMQLLSDDLRNAGFLAEFNPFPLTTPTLKPDPCATDSTSLKAALPIAVQGYDMGADAPACLSEIRPNTDILVIRRTSTCAVGTTGCDPEVTGLPYFQASGCSGPTELSSTNSADFYSFDISTANLIKHQKDCVTAAPYYQYRTHIYFIAENNKSGDGIPTLKRAELSASGGVATFAVTPLVEGIQDMQIEYGIDNASPTTGSPAFFTADPDKYLTCTGVDCMRYWRNTVAAKVSLLARNTRMTVGHKDDKTYYLGLKADGKTMTDGPYNDNYKRHLYTSVVRLNNTAGRNTP